MTLEKFNALKNERISEIDTAANAMGIKPKSETPVVETPVVETPVSSDDSVSKDSGKTNLIRKVGYPVLGGVVFGVSGMLLAKKLEKNEKVFIIGGVVLGATLGFLILKNWENKNSKK